MVTIFILSHTPGSELPECANGMDKLFHLLAYTALGLTALFAKRKRFARAPRSTALFVIFFCLAYGISDEFHQFFIPGRTPSLLDLLADLSGGLVAITAWSLWVWKFDIKNKIPVNS
jgi:VanZ family protein